MQTDTILGLPQRSGPCFFLISDGKVVCLLAECETGRASPRCPPIDCGTSHPAHYGCDRLHRRRFHAGWERSQNLDLCTTIEALIEEEDPTAQELADYLLQQSIRLDDGFPNDDMSVVVMLISPRSTDNVRHMNVSMSL